VATSHKRGSEHSEPGPAPAGLDVGPAPRDASELERWLGEFAGLSRWSEPLRPGHASALEYLVWAFFEGRAGFASGPTSPGEHPPAQADCVVWANRGGGKTFIGAVATMLDMIFKPGIEIRILGGSMDQSRRMYAHLRRLFDRPALAPLVRGKVLERGFALRNGSEVELLAQSQFSVRGTRVQKLRCDEVELFNREVWEAAQLVTKEREIAVDGVGPIRVRGSVECFSTMHLPFGLMSRLVREAGWNDLVEGMDAHAHAAPRRLFKWGVLDVLEACSDEHVCRPAEPGSECPLWAECGGKAKALQRRGGHVTVDEAIRQKRRVSQATWDSEMLCDRPRRNDSVYPEFSHRRHVVASLPWEGGREPEGQLRWIAGMDFGFRAPTVILLGAVDAEGVLWIVRERACAEVVLDEHARAIHQGLAESARAAAPGPGWLGKPDWVGIDPAGKQRSDQTGINAAEVLARTGLAVRANRKPQYQGFEAVRARLKPAGGLTPRIFIHARCTHLIECLEKYHYPVDKPESTVPVKDDTDHAADALRYLVQNLDRPAQSREANYLA
jgi:hypothetical protein